ncbi:MAG: glycoside hydrolase family 31 protein [Saprospiraceae bacterium]
MKLEQIIIGILLSTIFLFSCGENKNEIDVITPQSFSNANSNWWGAVINDGYKMPFQNGYTASLIGNSYGNQVQPLLLSDQGEVIWSEAPFEFQVENQITINDQNDLVFYKKAGANLKEAFKFASEKYFPPSGKMPDKLLFSKPQYNTWIELMYDQNEADILKYAQAILDNKLPPGVLMIDDNWQENYGKWDFHPGRFSNPKAMVDKLHEQGFKVMVWVCPFISADSDVYRKLRDEGLLLKNEEGKAAIIRWWNGASGLLDLSNPKAVAWFKNQLDFLQKKYGVDGFKLDAGDMEFYHNVVSHIPATSANDHAQLFAKIGLDYPLNEYRVNWKMGGQPIANRLRDKNHNWEDLTKLVPNMIMEGLMGYTFACPDMIGGGEFKSFLKLESIDQELIVRSAQCHALMPMMQFSVAPWRILDKEHLAAVLTSVTLRERFSDYILAEAEKSAKTGEPILRSMEYEFPKSGFEKVSNQFLIGEKLLVAPIVEQGVENVNILLPKGTWLGFDGKKYEGGQTIKLKVTLETLPFFEKE